MGELLQQLINGLTLGSIYGLIAIGYTLVYGIIGMINFAHGEIYMIGAFVAVLMLTFFSGLPAIFAILVALALGMVVAGAYGWTMERVAYRPVRESFRLAALISAIGVSIFLQNYIQLLQGARNRPIQPVISGGFELPIDNFAVRITYLQGTSNNAFLG